MPLLRHVALWCTGQRISLGRQAMSVDYSDDIFNSQHYEKVLRPPEEAETLPPWCYTSPAFYQREVERLFRSSWNCVGREERLPHPGDYFAFELAGVPVVLVRGENGTLRAFANTCRHRGTQLLEGEGNCERLICCPYHGWSYRLDGKLAGAPEMGKAPCFSKDEYGLIPIRLETRDGFVFINFDAESIGLDSYLGDFSGIFAPYGLGDMRCVRRREYEVACNWKLFIEVFMEWYHIKAVHPGSLDSVNYDRPDPPDKVKGEYVTQFGTHEGTGALLKGRGHTAFPPIATLSGRLLGGTRYALVYPAFIFAASTDSMWSFECYPQGPDRTKYAMNMCFPKSTVERPDFQELARAYFDRWDTGIVEDNTILERQQAGLTSPFARPGRLSSLEPVVGLFAQWVINRVLDGSEGRADS